MGEDRYAAERAEQLQGSLPYQPEVPHYPGYLSVHRRNPGHWDVMSVRRPGHVQWYYQQNPTAISYPALRDGETERAFRVRGQPGRVLVGDERWDPARPHPRGWLEFPSVAAAMAWITETLMMENPDE